MPGLLYPYFADDHQRLDVLLQQAVRNPGEFHREPFDEFRAGIVRHIWQEEKILLPAIRRWQGGEPFRDAARLRLDHGAIASLLVPVPTVGIVCALRAIFTVHNPLEEGAGGLYDCCESLAGKELESVMAHVHAAPAPPLMPYNADAFALEAMVRALARAGYNFAEISYPPL